MTTALFRDDAYLARAEAEVLGHTPEGGIVLDRTVFYPTGGGQPGDSGQLSWNGGTFVCGHNHQGRGRCRSSWSRPSRNPCRPWASDVTQQLDWDRRHRHMRVHTALHLLSVVIPLPVTGGQVSADKGRLDFDMPEVPEDKAAAGGRAERADRRRSAGHRGLDHRGRTACQT